jgi:hypothetical protein
MRAPRRHFHLLPLSLLFAGFGSSAVAADLVIHEWGTITSIHAPDGTPATGLNRIDESDVLPDFVHRYEPSTTRQPHRLLAKSPRVPGRPDVTMRLETPVIYFHPPPNQKYDHPIDITVRFRGGVLNEFYPDAAASIALDTRRVQDKVEAGVIEEWNGDVLNNYVVAQLQWKALRLHDTVVAPLTNSETWLASRAVNSVSVFSASAGEGEQFIFYRGVAHLDALFQTRLTRTQLHLRAPAQLTWLEAPMRVPLVWFADVRQDGRVAFHEHAGLTLSQEIAGKELARIKRFSAGNYTEGGAAKLRGSLKRALIAAGLYADEAEAMLNTWKASYFQQAGSRVFYIVPREWTDQFLPLEFSVPARVTRVIVGRIDIQ